ncbi:MAG: RluA family pseudouridine synthase [Planctomycetia bacterium]
MAKSPSRPPILLEDDHLIAVVKPAGLPTANAARGMPSMFTILREMLPAGAFLGVVSRLDAPVSGVLVMAKTRSAAADLARQFRERLVEKTYEAVAEGRFPAPLGQWIEWHDRIERRGEERRSRLRSVGPAACGDHDDESEDDATGSGGECHVRARVVKRLGEVSLVELEPSTGRRHQLRAQLAGRGCAIVGDKTYGARLPFPSAPGCGGAIALHARSLRFDHPATRQPVLLTARWPDTWAVRFPGLAAGRTPPPAGGRSSSGTVD